MFRDTRDNNNNDPAEEQIPLLLDDELAEENSAELLLEPAEDVRFLGVVVEKHPRDYQISLPQNPAKLKSLDQQIDECIDILNRGLEQAVIDKKRYRRKHISFSTCLLLGTVAVGSIPAILPVKLFHYAADRLFEITKPFEDELQELKPIYDSAAYDYHAANAQMTQVTKAFYTDKARSLVGGYNDRRSGHEHGCAYLYSHWLHSQTKVSAAYSGRCESPFERFCDFAAVAEQYDVFPMEEAYCNDVLNDLCQYSNDFVAQGTNYTEVCHADTAAYNAFRAVDLQWQNITNQERNALYEFRQYDTATLAAIVTPMIMAVGFTLGICMFMEKQSRYRREKKSFEKVFDVIEDPADLNKLVNLAERLGVDLQDTKLADMRMACYVKKSEITAAWKKRIAFLGGKKRPDSSIHANFFKYRESRNLKKEVMRHTGLMPRCAVGK